MLFLRWILDTVFPPRATQMLVRAASTISCDFKPRVITISSLSIFTLLSYHSPLVQACILEAKFHKSRKAQELLGTLLADYIKVSRISGKVVIIPIPLGKKRRRERGYNQTEEIARFSGESVAADALLRTRETLPQTTLGRESRIQNMENVFVAARPLDPETTYILLDDVVTTGATLLAAHEAMKIGGAKRILVVALAH
jgi:ComF family protein